MTRISPLVMLVCAACIAVSCAAFAQPPLAGNGLQQFFERVVERPVYPMEGFPASSVWKSEYDHKLDGTLRVQESTRIEIAAREDYRVLIGNYQDHQAVGKENKSVFRGEFIPGTPPVVTLTQHDEPGYTAIYTGKLVAPNRFVGTYMDNRGYSGDWSLELIPESDDSGNTTRTEDSTQPSGIQPGSP